MRLAATILLISGLLWAQPQEPSFDVARVKHVGSAIVTGPSGPQLLGCRYTGNKVECGDTLHGLIENAYGVESWQVQGADWMEGERYEVSATMPEGGTREIGRRMMRRLLAERFGIEFHTVRKEFPVFAMVVASGGVKLKEVEKPASFKLGITAGQGDDTLRFEGKPGIPISSFVAYLRGPAGRPIVDETGLTGYYAIDVEWVRDPAERKNAGILTTLGKIGLKLESRKKTYDVMVIDKASKEPAEN